MSSKFISPVLHGGLQKQDIRSGTVPVNIVISEVLSFINIESKNKNNLLDSRKICKQNK